MHIQHEIWYRHTSASRCLLQAILYRQGSEHPLHFCGAPVYSFLTPSSSASAPASPASANNPPTHLLTSPSSTPPS